MRSKMMVGSGIAVLVAGVITAAVVGSAVLSGPASATVTTAASSAVGYANQHGYRSSIGVIDTSTGGFSGAGDFNSAYASESVMKVFIATRLLMTGQMTGWNSTTAYKMITQSDDASANALYGRTGGDGVINWVKQALNIPNLGSPPLRSGWWGGTQITANGMAKFYNIVRHRADVWPWLGNAMHHATQYGSDGTYQFFGIPSATSGAAIKQGWGGDDAAGQPAFNSTGLVNGDRFAVVILTQGGTYGTPIANILTSEARLLMPGGQIEANSPSGRVDFWQLRGRYLTLGGWALDPNEPTRPQRIVFFVNGRQASYVATTQTRADVNAQFHTTGTHGFSGLLALPDGTDTVCATALNLGAGGNSQIGCQTFSLTGTPIAFIDGSTQRGAVTTFTGWAFDYDAPGRQMLVRAYVNGRYAAGTYTTGLRTDVNAIYHGTGLKGYSLPIPLPTGSSTVCLTVQNVGPGATKSLGCYGRRVAQSPIGGLQTPLVSGRTVTLNGWVLDFDAPSRAATYVLTYNGRTVSSGPTPIVRGDVNSRYGVTGKHGFTRSFNMSPGTSQFCLTGVNIGAGPSVFFGCRSFTISAAVTAKAAPNLPSLGGPTTAPRPSPGPIPSSGSGSGSGTGSSSGSSSSSGSGSPSGSGAGSGSPSAPQSSRPAGAGSAAASASAPDPGASAGLGSGPR